MPATKYTIEVTRTGDHFEATVPDLNITATGATFDQAAINAELAIARAQTATHTKKRRVQTSTHLQHQQHQAS